MSAFLISAATLLLTSSIALRAADDVKYSGITRPHADEILDQLKQIRNLLEGQVEPAAATVGPQKHSVKVERGNSLDSDFAPLTMIEFSDYQYPFCRGFESTSDQIRRFYIYSGKLRFVSRNLPLEIHHDTRRSGEAALCAGDQERSWPLRELLFSPSLAAERILDAALALELDPVLFRSCVDGEKQKTEILGDMKDAQALQITGTPAFEIEKRWLSDLKTS